MAVHQVNPQGSKLAALDPIWDRIRGEAEDIVRREPELATFIYSSVLHHSRLEDSVVHRVAERIDTWLTSGVSPWGHAGWSGALDPALSTRINSQAAAKEQEEKGGRRDTAHQRKPLRGIVDGHDTRRNDVHVQSATDAGICA